MQLQECTLQLVMIKEILVLLGPDKSNSNIKWRTLLKIVWTTQQQKEGSHIQYDPEFCEDLETSTFFFFFFSSKYLCNTLVTERER